MALRIKFTWKKFREILLWILPIVTKGGKSMAEPQKPGLFTVPTTVVTTVSEPTKHTTSASLIPGAVAAGALPSAQVTISSGFKVSWSQVATVLTMLILFLRTFGQTTGLFHLPDGIEDQISAVVGKSGDLWAEIITLLIALGLYRLREAMPAKVVLAKTE